MAYQVLLVEDDLELASLTRDYLARHDIDISIQPDPLQVAAQLAAQPWDMLVLDIMLPGKDGLSLCHELRPVYSGPIVMLTSLDSDMNHILGLELGANDYILKSTPPAVVAARLRAQLRQHKPAPPAASAGSETSATAKLKRNGLRFGQLRVDESNREVWLAEERIALSTTEFDLLCLLASHAGEVLERDTLLRQVRGFGYDGFDRSIDIAISRLRKKLGDEATPPRRIKTVRNKGYLFSPDQW